MLIDFNIIKNYGIVPRGTIHVGMHKAEEYPVYWKAGVNRVIFVEANEELANSWVDPKSVVMPCHVVHAAVSDKVEEVTFSITNNGESSSILELGDHAQIYPNIVKVEEVKMMTTTLNKIIEMVGNPIQEFNILNLDIQGAELKAMKGLTDWSHIEAVFTEVNYREMYKGCALIGEIEEFLDGKGFRKVEEVDTGAGWGDALFVR
jgi:FkbM family methyltransferase